MSDSEIKNITDEFVEVVKSWVKLDDDIKQKNIGHLEVFIESYKLMDTLFKTL